MEDDECWRLPPRPRLLTQDLAFPVQYRARKTFNIEATGSHSTLSSHSSNEVLSSTVATQTVEPRGQVDSSVGCSPILPSRACERANSGSFQGQVGTYPLILSHKIAVVKLIKVSWLCQNSFAVPQLTAQMSQNFAFN